MHSNVIVACFEIKWACGVARSDVELSSRAVFEEDWLGASFNVNNTDGLVLVLLKSGRHKRCEFCSKVIVEYLNECLIEPIGISAPQTLNIGLNAINCAIIGDTNNQRATSCVEKPTNRLCYHFLEILIHLVLLNIPAHS